VAADIISGVAALATLVAVFYARATVQESRKGRQEASLAHVEEMTREARLLEATQTAHEREMEERRRAHQREMWLERLRQVGRVQELLAETSDIARHEIEHPPEKVALQFGTWTRTTSGLTRVEAALVILEKLGGPAMPEARQLTSTLRMMNTPPQRIVGDTMGELARSIALAENDESFPRAGLR
jgi:hypothetical protein